jgi:hypothetical protein
LIAAVWRKLEKIQKIKQKSKKKKNVKSEENIKVAADDESCF